MLYGDIPPQYGFGRDLDPLFNLIQSLKNKGVTKVAVNFDWNLLTTKSILQFPVTVATDTQIYNEMIFGPAIAHTYLYTDAKKQTNDQDTLLLEAINYGMAMAKNDSPPTKEREDTTRGKVISQFNEWIKMGWTRYYLGFIKMHQVTAIMLWTAFETLINDLWETAVNQLSHLVGENVKIYCKNHTKMNKLTREKIKLPDPLLGTQVRSYKTLHSVSSIQTAYQCLFDLGTYQRKFLESVLGDDKMIFIHHLCETRNLLVHRGGKIDEQFILRMQPMIDLEQHRGKELLLYGQDLWVFAESVFHLGIALIKFFESELSYNTSK
jgi:hypothetical protein